MDEPKRINAPFTKEQVETLNKFQKSGIFHPFTCGSGARCVEKIGDMPSGEPIEASTELVATENGWICPKCGYTQDWAWDYMADADMIDRFESGAYL